MKIYKKYINKNIYKILNKLKTQNINIIKHSNDICYIDLNDNNEILCLVLENEIIKCLYIYELLIMYDKKIAL